jgi:hypothetical protein
MSNGHTDESKERASEKTPTSLFESKLNHDIHNATVLSQVLRAIATICCIPESLMQFDEACGVECVSNMLRARTLSQSVRSEAAGVIAQITSPGLVDTQSVLGFLEHMVDIVEALTGLCREAEHPDVFLLACAALANITSIDCLACDYLMQFNTVSTLIEACDNNMAPSVFAKDQVMTVVTNMLSSDSNSVALISTPDVLHWIVGLLGERTSWKNTFCSINESDLCINELGRRMLSLENTTQVMSPVELAACERVLQKAANVIRTLSEDPETASRFISFNCVPVLVELCTKPAARANSDAVIIPCLTALRKLYTACDPNQHTTLSEDSIDQLILSDITQSFLHCSTASESFI